VLDRHLGPGHVAPPGYPALEPSGEPLAQAGAAREAAAVLDAQGPIAVQGTEEFPAAFAELHSRLALGAAPLGLLGPSMGAAVAQLVLTDPGAASTPARRCWSVRWWCNCALPSTPPAAGSASPTRGTGVAVAARLGRVVRADRLLSAGQPAVQLVVGAQDDPEGYLERARRLKPRSRAATTIVPESNWSSSHALADEPGVTAAPQPPTPRRSTGTPPPGCGGTSTAGQPRRR